MFNKFAVWHFAVRTFGFAALIPSLTFSLNSFGFANQFAHLMCDVRQDIWDICPTATNNIDATNEELVERACDSVSKKVSDLTNGIYRCKYQGVGEPYECVLRTSRIFEPRTEKFDCRSDYRQQNEEKCTQYTSEVSKSYCEWAVMPKALSGHPPI